MALYQITVKTGVSRESLELSETGITVRIRARPIKGEANEYLVQYIADQLGLSRRQVVLVKGYTSGHKTMEIDLSLEELTRRIREQHRGKQVD